MSNETILIEFNKLVDQIKYDIDNPKPNLSKQDKISNRYRLKHIVNAIDIINKYNKKIRAGRDLEHISGIGKGIIGRIDEILKTGKLKEIVIRAKETKYLLNIKELEQIIGIGNKTAYDLVMNHNIKSIKELVRAYNNGKIDLPESILIGLKYHNLYKTNIPRVEIDKINIYLRNKISTISKNIIVTLCGSYRRGKLVSNDIDVLVAHKNVKTKLDIRTKQNYLHKIVTLLKQTNFLVDDITFDKYEYKYMGFCKIKQGLIRRIDIRYVPYNSYYPAILYFTGPGEFNSKMRHIAKLLGFKLNEYGLYKINDKTSTLTQLKIQSEKQIFDHLDMEYLDPENRY